MSARKCKAITSKVDSGVPKRTSFMCQQRPRRLTQETRSSKMRRSLVTTPRLQRQARPLGLLPSYLRKTGFPVKLERQQLHPIDIQPVPNGAIFALSLKLTLAGKLLAEYETKLNECQRQLQDMTGKCDRLCTDRDKTVLDLSEEMKRMMLARTAPLNPQKENVPLTRGRIKCTKKI